MLIKKEQLKKDLPDIRPGDIVKVHQKIKEGDKTRIQIFEGLTIARKHGKGIEATITVRRTTGSVGVERIFPIHSPAIEKMEIVERRKARRSKLYYLRKTKKRKIRLKRKELPEQTKKPKQDNKGKIENKDKEKAK